MKKIIIYALLIVILPPVIMVIAALLFKDIRLGSGGSDISSHLLGVNVLVEVNGLYKDMDVEEYLLGVLPGTIPADYDRKALEVQAIVMRTNILKSMQGLKTNEAQNLPFTYMGQEDCHNIWGERNYEKNRRRFEQAVVNTAGLVIKSEGQLIDAMYHEVSIGKTVSGKEVFGQEISYLQSVDSGFDVEAKNYMNIITYKKKDLQELLKIKGEETIIEVLESTENGFVKKLKVNDNSYSGEEAMEILQLPSMNFYVEKIEENYRFVCLGKGNCLGLSQYGANRLACEGTNVEDILKHYYNKVDIVSYEDVKR